MLTPHRIRFPFNRTERQAARSLQSRYKHTLSVTFVTACLSIATAGAGHRAIAQEASASAEDAFSDMAGTARFLTQSTFGPKPNDVIALTGSSPSQWLLAEFAKDPSLHQPIIATYLAQGAGSNECAEDEPEEDEEEPEEDEEDGSENEDDDSGDDEDGGRSDEDEDESEDEIEDDVDEDNEEGDEDGEEECEVEEELTITDIFSPNYAFWINAITGSDQVRQRMAFALSQIMVISNNGGELLTDTPPAVGYYQDILTSNALGNYRDLLEAVTYSPAMGYYLTYLGNSKGDPTTGRVPDENYARELMQLFTIGLVELNLDGSAKTDAQGNAIETYTNDDITGLARVFTGLATACDDFGRRATCTEDEGEEESDEAGEEGDDEFIEDEFEDDEYALFTQPMKMFEEQHSPLEKSFLGTTIPAGTNGSESIGLALDAIFNHPNVAPFVSRQLIQRFVTSNPAPDYIERVATAFEAGSYTLPDGSIVGDTRRGDLQATVAAILFDDAARTSGAELDNSFGKIREPVIRFTNWARAFNVGTITPEYMPLLWDTSSPNLLGQQPYGAPSVFNFYRPGYVAPGTLTGAAGLTVPELQIVNAATTPGYINFMTAFVAEGAQNSAVDDIREFTEDDEINVDNGEAQLSFRPDYEFEFDLAMDAEALVDRVEAVLTYIDMSPESKAGIIEAVNGIPFNPTDSGLSAARRVHLAIIMVMTTPDYLVQR